LSEYQLGIETKIELEKLLNALYNRADSLYNNISKLTLFTANQV